MKTTTEKSLIWNCVCLSLVLMQTGCEDSDRIDQYQVEKDTRQIKAFEGDLGVRTQPSKPARMLAAIIIHDDKAWFVKAQGDIKKVAGIVEQYEEFISGLKFNELNELQWSLPEGWQEVANKSSFRVATLDANGVDVSISHLPAFGDPKELALKNINRWRGQLQLPDLNLENLDAQSTSFQVESFDGWKVDITGLTGGGPAAPFANQSTPPSSDSTVANKADSGKSELVPYVPDGWKLGRQSSMRAAAFEVVNGEKKVEITVIPLGPQAGTLVENVNRWRGELKLEDQTEQQLKAAVEPMDVAGVRSHYVKIVGASETTLAVVVTKSDRMWFIKLRGDSQLAEQQEDAFREFSKSLNIP